MNARVPPLKASSPSASASSSAIPEETDWLLRYRDGEAAAFELLHARYSPKVWGYLVSRVRNPQAREELFQTVFLKIHQSRDQYDPKFPVSAWIFTIVRHAMIDHWRRRPEEEVPEDEEALARHAVPGDSAEAALAAAQSARQQLAGLPPDQRAVVELRTWGDLDHDEIARRLGKSESNVRQLWSRALRRLRELANAASETPSKRKSLP